MANNCSLSVKALVCDVYNCALIKYVVSSLTSLIDLPRTHKQQLAGLQQQYRKGEHTDVIIRVRIREDTDGDTVAIAGAATGDYIDIHAHANFACAVTPYFDKCLSREWTEAAERRVELTVEDEQEPVDTKLLIKLAYADCYTYHGDELLPLQTRLRLAVRAAVLEFVGAVDQIVASPC